LHFILTPEHTGGSEIKKVRRYQCLKNEVFVTEQDGRREKKKKGVSDVPAKISR